MSVKIVGLWRSKVTFEIEILSSANLGYSTIDRCISGGSRIIADRGIALPYHCPITEPLNFTQVIHRPELVIEGTLVPDLHCNNCSQELVVENYPPEDYGTVVEMLCPGCGAILSVRGQVRFDIIDGEE